MWVQVQHCGCIGSLYSFLLPCHPEKDSSCCTWQGKGVIPISGLCHIQNVHTCSAVPSLSLHRTLGVSAAFRHVSLSDQFFHCLYLPVLSTIQSVEPCFFLPSSSVYCLQIKNLLQRWFSFVTHISSPSPHSSFVFKASGPSFPQYFCLALSCCSFPSSFSPQQKYFILLKLTFLNWFTLFLWIT